MMKGNSDKKNIIFKLKDLPSPDGNINLPQK
jgi:hypothetical protein